MMRVHHQRGFLRNIPLHCEISASFSRLCRNTSLFSSSLISCKINLDVKIDHLNLHHLSPTPSPHQPFTSFLPSLHLLLKTPFSLLSPLSFSLLSLLPHYIIFLMEEGGGLKESFVCQRDVHDLFSISISISIHGLIFLVSLIPLVNFSLSPVNSFLGSFCWSTRFPAMK